jgi:hypothetical protein
VPNTESDAASVQRSLDDEIDDFLGPNGTAALCTEALSAVKTAHLRLLDRFATSSRNELRLEIRLFRHLLHDVAAWAQHSVGLADLAHKLQWWESCWYEREYGDSQFDELTAQQKDLLAQYQSHFDHQYACIWTPTVNLTSLMSEISAAATNDRVSLPSLQRLRSHPSWDDLSFLLDEVYPTMNAALVEAIARSVLGGNPAQYTGRFLDFLNQTPSFTIDWTIDYSHIFVVIDTPRTRTPRRVTGRGVLRQATLDWIRREQSLRTVDDAVEEEASIEINRFVEQMKRRAA